MIAIGIKWVDVWRKALSTSSGTLFPLYPIPLHDSCLTCKLQGAVLTIHGLQGTSHFHLKQYLPKLLLELVLESTCKLYSDPAVCTQSLSLPWTWPHWFLHAGPDPGPPEGLNHHPQGQQLYLHDVGPCLTVNSARMSKIKLILPSLVWLSIKSYYSVSRCFNYPNVKHCHPPLAA